MWTSILRTYSDAGTINTWNSLIEMTNIFHETALNVADKLGFTYNLKEAKNVQAYIQTVKPIPRKANPLRKENS